MMKRKWMPNGKIAKITLFVVGAWIIAQLIAIIAYWNCAQGPDQIGYMKHALESVAANTTYPSMMNINDVYLHSPGMVNYLILIHILTGTTDFNIDKIVNLFLNIGILANIFFLARKFFGNRTAYISVIIYCLLPTNIFAPIWHLSEIPYLFLALTGFSLSTSSKVRWVILASVLFAVAHTFRPLILAFLITSVVLYIIERRKLLNYICIILPYIAILFAVGTYNKSKTGYFVTSSTTGGYNLIMTANDDAKLYADFSLHSDTANIAYIPNANKMSFAEKDSIHMSRAIQWIKDNPLKYAKQFVIKIGRLWSGDVWSMPVFSKWDDFNYIRLQPQEKQGRLIMIRRIIQFVEGLPYYAVLLMFLFALFKKRKDIFSRKGLLLLIFALGTAGTCLFIAEVRFHYPYLFCMTIWAAYGITRKSEMVNNPVG